MASSTVILGEGLEVINFFSVSDYSLLIFCFLMIKKHEFSSELDKVAREVELSMLMLWGQRRIDDAGSVKL
jgi:hypothetical protein